MAERGAYPSSMPRDATTGTRAERRDRASAETRARILEAARVSLLAVGYVSFSTRRVAETADVPLSQIHYYFGSKQELILAVLAAENDRLLARQAAMYATSEPLWRQWEQACDFLEADLESGYVRILQEMIAAGWSDPNLAASVRTQLGGWFRLLSEVARREQVRIGHLGPFTPDEVAALMALPFLGAEAAILLGMPESEVPTLSALRKVGILLQGLEPASPVEDNDGRGPAA
jgi:AcrR family transcriptional regulator